jgi:hypothetical protein
MVRTRAVLGVLLALAILLSAAAPAAAFPGRRPAIGEEMEGFYVPAIWRQALELFRNLLLQENDGGELRPTLAAGGPPPPPPPHDPSEGGGGGMDPNG